MNVLELKHAKKAFDGVLVLKDIDMHVAEGEVVSIIGPSGSGKSTLLRCCTFLETLDDGSLSYGGREVISSQNGKAVYGSKQQQKEAMGNFGLVFQNFNLFPHYSVLKNIMDAPVSVQKRNPKEVETEARALLNKMGLGDKADAYPNELSGGEQQRVAIARALVNQPTILLADEPTGNLDPQNAWEIMMLLQEVNKMGTTVVVVTHNNDIVDIMQKRVVTLNEGTVVRDDKKGGYEYERD